MKKIVVLLLAISMIAYLNVSALADEENQILSTEDLIQAIQDAGDGDTLTLIQTIYIYSDCIIGDADKQINIVLSDDFMGQQVFCLYDDAGNVSFQNLNIQVNVYGLEVFEVYHYVDNDINVSLTLDNIDISNSMFWQIANIVCGDATIKNCNFSNNNPQHSGISNRGNLIIQDCTFDGNVSDKPGLVLSNSGIAQMIDCTVTNNTINDDGTPHNGVIECNNGSNTTIKGGLITGNKANYGGAISSFSELELEDVEIYGNEAYNKAAQDIFCPSSYIKIGYTNSMFDVYDGEPIGFYQDAVDNPFNSENPVFIGESVDMKTPVSYGLRFVFKSDLPEPEPEPEPEPQPPVYFPPYIPPVIDEEIEEEPPIKDKKPELILAHNGAVFDTTKRFELFGYEDGLKHEEDYLTRAQFAVLVYRALTEASKEELETGELYYSDVQENQWYTEAIQALTKAGIFAGCGDGLFIPDGLVSQGQLIAVLTRFTEPLTVDVIDVSYKDSWAYSSILTAYELNWIDNLEDIQVDRPVTRGEVVEFVNSVFDMVFSKAE